MLGPSTFDKRKVRWAVALLLLVTIAGFYWKLTLTQQYTWMQGPDLAEQVLPWFDVQAREWHAGRIPLWDPYVWVGQPLIGEMLPGVVYPLNWLLFAMPLTDGHLERTYLNWYYVIIHFMAAGFAYLFCRDLGRSRSASFAAGLIFALSGFLGNIAWPMMINGAVWIPLVFLFQFRVLRGERPIANAALSGMFLGIAFLSGHHQVPMFTTVAWALVWAWHCWHDRRLVRAAALSLTILALTSAMQTLSAYEYGHLARRWVNAPEPVEWIQPVPYIVHAQYDLKAFSLFGIVFPGVRMHFDPFIGVIGLTLALLACAVYWHDRRVRLLGLLGIGALVYSLGHNSVFQGVLYAITPDLDKARTPSAIVVLMQFAAAALAAFGIDHVREDALSPWLKRTRAALVVFGLATMAVCFFVLLANRMTFPVDDRVILPAFIALALAAMLGGRFATPAPLILLLLFELGNTGQIDLLHNSDRAGMQWLDKLKGNADIAAFLRGQPGFARADVADDLFAPNWGQWHSVEMSGGKGASITYNVLDSEFFGPLGRRIWGVAYTLSNKPNPALGEEVFTGASGLKVYRRDAFPRAWAVHELVVKGDPEGYQRKATVRAPAPKLESCDGEADRVQLVEHLADRLAIDVDLACTGMVVLSDTFYPGWRARVDHRLTQIYEVNGAMRGVVVPKGRHVVTMRYRPTSVYAGAGLTMLGVVAAMVLWRRRG